MPDWLHDPLTDRTVRVAAERARRPNDFTGDGEPRRCPFCRGAEEDTPAEADRIVGPDGEWLVRAAPNLYPAVGGAEGAHEVVIESPRHVARFVDLSDDEATDAVRMWLRRLAHWQAQAGVRHTVLFKNEGPAAGASLEHVHSQLVALRTVPAPTAAMWARIAEVPPGADGGRSFATLDAWRLEVPPAPRVAWEAWLRPTAP